LGDAVNPYAPPLSDVATPPAAAGAVFRDGDLVRMHAAATLPDRCIRCNRAAGGYRAERALYWRPNWWRGVIWGSVPALVVLGTMIPMALALFWVLVIVLPLADHFVHRKIVVEYGLCRNHRRWRAAARNAFVASWILLIGLVAATLRGFRATEHGWFWMLALVMLALAVLASMLYRLRLARITESEIWLRGTGRPFHEGLPASNS
jgi:hypothetical protein